MAQKINPLITLKTNLRTLRYSKDQYGGGSSRQPYVRKQLEADFNTETGARRVLIGATNTSIGPFSKIKPGGRARTPDFLLREGTLRSSREDVSRLTQLLLDVSPPTGPLFVAKQNLLSLANVNTTIGYQTFDQTQDSSDLRFGGERAIDDLVTNVANNATNIFNKNTGLNQGPYSPLGTLTQAALGAGGVHVNKQGLNPLAPTNTSDNAGFPTYLNAVDFNNPDGNKSRLAPLYTNQIKNPDNLDLYKYKGGPGSILGVGQTIISIGINNKTFNKSSSKIFFTGKGDPTRYVLTQLQQNNKAEQNLVLINQLLPSFTQTVRDSEGNPEAKLRIPKTIDYINKNAAKRTHFGNPGRKGNISSYAVGKRPDDDNSTNNDQNSIEKNANYKNALDQINALPLYKSDNVKANSDDFPVNDLVKFRIAVIDNDNPSLKTYIHFRAFIDNMSDNFTSKWNSDRLMGRGENFYKYDGFDRNISLSWTVAAQSKQELIPMYQKLNYLASVCAPDYSEDGYMRGNLISLTVGGWCYEQVGIMRSITLDVPSESPWEIGINDTEKVNDSTVKELPMIIKVTGFQFSPIHNFVPRVQKNVYNDPLPKSDGFISRYGKQHYIALSAGGKTGDENNYDGGENNWNYIPNKNPTPPSNTQQESVTSG